MTLRYLLISGTSMLALAASAADAATLFSYTGTVQTWVAPTTGLYDFSAWGAPGGSSFNFPGGQGAIVSARFLINAGTSLNLVVGGAGFSNLNSGGGGGGSWVYGASDNLYLVAGGGGGAGLGGPGFSSTSTDGSSSGGSVGGGFSGGAGGAGWNSAGAGFAPFIYGGQSRPSWAGGSTVFGTIGAGGFGGGGAGFAGGGGGGGYTGGPGGYGLAYARAGGYAGTSYVAAWGQNVVFDTGSTLSQISISEFVPSGGTVPEPASWALLLTGFGLIGGVLRARRGTLARA